jgi:SCP-2 sterol transfer family
VTTHQFLSDEWMAAAKSIRDRHAHEGVPFPVSLRVNQVITDVPFGAGEVRTYFETTDGRLVMDHGELENPDATVITDYATARALFVEQDQAAGMQAFMAGKIKVQGDMTKLMAMSAGQNDDVARTIAAEIKAITS